MNKVIIIGNLTRDPELRTTPNGISVCTFSVAVNRRFSKENEVDYLPVTVWRAQADNCAKYLKKGSKVAVTGSIQIRSYDKEGEKRYATDIVAEEVEFLSSKSQSQGDSDYGSSAPVSELEPVDSNELPF